jgi:hypothetical protein
MEVVCGVGSYTRFDDIGCTPLHCVFLFRACHKVVFQSCPYA